MQCDCERRASGCRFELVQVRAGDEHPAVSALAALVGNAGHDMEVLVTRPHANQLQVHTLPCPNRSHTVLSASL